MSAKILVFVLAMVILSISLISGIILMDNAAYNDAVSYERVTSALDDLNGKITEMLDQSEKSAVSISQDYRVISALKKNDFNALKSALDSFNGTLQMDTISITDVNGNVIIRQHDPDKYGDNILSQTNVQKALTGSTSTTLEPGALARLSTRSGAPIYDDSGKMIGAVVTGYVFSADILDELKALHNTELTIFAGDERIATTIKKNGQRVVGTKLDSTIAKILLEDEQPYEGKADILEMPFITKYEPLRDTNGDVVGIVFAGISRENAVAATRATFLHILIAVPIVVIICGIILLAFVNKNIKQPMHKLTRASEMLAGGQLDVKLDTGTRKDEIAMLTGAMQTMITQLRSYISDISFILTAMSENDFTVSNGVEYVGDFMPIKNAVNNIMRSLNSTLEVVNQSAIQFSSSADQLSSSAQGLAQGSGDQSEAILRLTDSITQISEDASINAEHVRRAKEYVEQAAASVTTGNEQMTKMLAAMEAIKDSSMQISNIIKTIDDISFQTNILALNAAVEAARAGTAGKGFAVVAEEVKNLASKSAQAAKQTSELINNSILTVKEGYDLADSTATIFQQVTEKAGLVESSILEIDRASTMQSTEIMSVTKDLQQISDVVQVNSATSQQTAAASQELLSQAEILREQVSKFKLADTH